MEPGGHNETLSEEYINYVEREMRLQEELQNALQSPPQSPSQSPSNEPLDGYLRNQRTPPNEPLEPIPTLSSPVSNEVFDDIDSSGEFEYSSDSNHEQDIVEPTFTLGFRQRFEQELENTFTPEQLGQMYNDLQSNNLEASSPVFRVIDSIVNEIIHSRDISGNPIEETPEETPKETPEETNTRECVVCYKKAEIDDVVSTPCNHYYCKGCFFKWLKESNTCAYCRNPFTEYTNWEYSYEEENEELRTHRQLVKDNMKLVTKFYKKKQQLSDINKKLKDVNAEVDKMNLSAIRRRELAEFNEGYGDAIIGILDKNVLTKVDSIDYKCHYKNGFCSGFKSRYGMTFLQYRNAVKGNFYVDGALNKKKIRRLYRKRFRPKQNNLFDYNFTSKRPTNGYVLENDDDSDSSSSSSDSSSSDSSSSSTRSKYSRYRQKTLYIDENGLIKIE